jgi:hypothetical protein
VAAAVLTLTVHDCPGPHGVVGALLPLSVQTEDPVEHEVVPVLQGFVGWHVWLGVHDMQLPAKQKRLVPQLVPSVAGIPESTQTGAPVVQEMVPLWQTFVGVHGAPVLHATQLPLPLQTIPVPQDDPGALLPLSTQTDEPVEQEVAPFLQALLG